MADVNANIGVHIDTSDTIAQLKALRAEISRFNQAVSKSSAAAAIAQRDLQTNLLNSINATGKFHARMGLVRTSTEAFTHALETNKLTMGQYFRYAGGATTTFRKLFTKEFDTISQVAQDRVKRMQTQYIKLGRDASGAMKAISITPTSLNMKDYGTQVALAAQRQALFNQLLKQGSTNLLNFGKNTQWAGRQLMVGFTVPLAYLGTAAAKTFMAIEEQAIKFKRVYGEMFTTTDQTNKALEDVRKLAEEFTKYGIAVEKTIELAAKAAATGKMGAELMAQVQSATRLAVLGGVEQEQALDTTISLTNAFGIAADELAQKINFLNAVENQTVVSIEDLTVAIPKAGPVVKQLGGSVEDLAFFLTAMKEGGINASEGANALKSGLASLINPTDKASSMLAEMGINIKGIVEANKGNVKGVVLDFAAALDTLDPLNRARAIEQMFGKFQFSRLSTLFANVSKEGTQASRVLDLTAASVEELAILSERELKTVEDAIGVNFKEAVQKLRLALEPIGKVFLKTITPIAETIGRLLDKFNNLGDGTKKFIVIATTLVGVIGPTFLMTFGLLANAVANIIKLFGLMRGGFLRLKGQSTVLAEQTNYLTMEQREAATVAAALDQAHNKLTQRFTSEAVALEQLRAAFDRATAAQTRFAASNPGMMVPGFKGAKVPGKKFAGGTTEVVGGQAGKDSVPALLMPGEAVVPTDIAQDKRFQPLIAALVSGKINQYGDGTGNAGSQGRGIPKTSTTVFFDFDDTLAKSTAAIEEWKQKNGLTGKTTPAMYDAFNAEVAKGNIKVPGISENIDKLKKLQASGVDVRILTARTASEVNLASLKEVLKTSGITIADDKIILNASAEADAKYKANEIKKFLKENPGSRAQLIDDNLENVRAVKNLSSAKELKKRFGALATAASIENAQFVEMKDGRGAVKFQGRVYPVGENFDKAQAIVRRINNDLAGKRTQIERLEYAKWASARFSDLVDNRSAGRLISEGRIFRKDRGRGGVPYEVRQALNNFAANSSYENAIKAFNTPEQKAIKAAIDASGVKLTPKQLDNLLQIQASHIYPSVDENGNRLKFNDPMKWKQGHVIDDLGALNNYLNRTEGKNFNSAANAFLNRKELFDTLPPNLKSTIRQDLAFASSGVHPTTQAQLDSIARVAELDRAMDRAGVYSNKQIIKDLGLGSGVKNLSKNVYQAQLIGVLRDLRAQEPGWYKNVASKILDLSTLKSVSAGGKPVPPFAIQPGEIVTTAKGAYKATPQTGVPRTSATQVVGGGPKDTRLIPGAGVRRITPRGIVAMGAETGFDQLRQTGSTTAQQIARERRISLSEAKKLLKAEQTLAAERAKGTDVTEKSGKATSQKTKLDKQQLRQLRYDKISRISSPVSMAAGTAAMAGAMMGAPEGFTKMMMGVSVISGLLPLMTNPWMLAVAAVVAMAGLVMKFNNDLKKAREAGIELAKAMTMSADDVKELGIISGKVSASEIMDRRRQNFLNVPATEPQRQFGQNVMQSEFGKKMLGNIQTMSKSGMATGDIAKNLSTQLGQAIMQGVITTDQAKGIASALGEQLGSYEIPLQISGTLNTIFGPNGENLANSPLQVALEIKKESMDTQAKAFETAIANRKPLLTAGGTAAVLGGAATVGAVAVTQFWNPVGWTAAAAGVGLVVKGLWDQNKAKAQNLQLDTASIQLGIEAVAQGQDLIDSINVRYDKLIAEAKTQQEISDLEGKRKDAIKAVNAENAKSLQFIVDQKNQMTDGAFEAAIKAQADMMYKEGPMSVFKDQALEALSSLEESDFKAKMQIGFATGDIDPLTLINILNMASNNKPIEQEILFLVKEEGFANMGTMTQLINSAVIDPKTGQPDPLQFQTILTYVNKNDKTFDEDMEAIKRIADFKGAYGVTLDMKTNGIQKIQIADTALQQIKDLPEKITKEALIAANTNGQFNDIINNWTQLSEGKDQINKNLIVNYRVGVIDPNIQNAAKSAGQSVPEYLAKGFVAPQPKTPTPGEGDGGGKGSRDTTLDDLLKRLKFISDASIDAQGGVKELLRITNGEGLTKFAGITQQLMAGPKGGFNREFISFLETMDNKTRAVYMSVKNGQVILTKQGERLKQAFNEKVVREYQVAQAQTIQDTKAQSAALLKLAAAGVDSGTALEMVADANLAVAINANNISTKELQQMAKDAANAKKQVRDLNLELLNTAEALRGDITKGQTTIKALAAARMAGIVDPKVLDYISKNEAIANQIVDKGINNAKVRETLALAAANDKLAESISGLVNPAQAALEKFSKLKDAAFAIFDKQERSARKDFNDSLNRSVQSLDKFKNIAGSPKFAQYGSMSIKNAITAAQRQIDAYQDNIKNIENTKIRPLDIQIESSERTIKQYQENLKKSASALKFKDGSLLPQSAYDDIRQKLQDTISSKEYDLEFNPTYGSRVVEKLEDDIKKKEFDLEFNPVFGQRVLEGLQKNVEEIQRGIELQFSRPIAALEQESSVLSHDLTLIDKAADAINEKYDAQAKALEQVSNINQEIINQQKSQLDLASAITQGDIAAAAKAAQESRAQAASAAAQRAGGTLDAARQAELSRLVSASGMTRAQIEERQFQISEQKYGLEEQSKIQQAKIVVIQDQIYSIEQARAAKQIEIRDIQDKIAAAEEKRVIVQREIRGIQDDLNAGDIAREKFNREFIVPLEEHIVDLQSQKQGYLDQVASIETDIFDLQTSILDPLNAEVDARQQILDDELIRIDTERQYWEDRQTALEEAVSATDNLASAATDAQKAFEAAKAAYDGINSKEITITVKKIIEETTVPGSAFSSANTKLAYGDQYNMDTRSKMYGGKIKGYMGGGKIKPIYRPMGGIIPYMANGGFKSIGSDTVPAMLTPGEYVVNRAATEKFLPILELMNNSKYPSMIGSKLSSGNNKISRSFNNATLGISQPTSQSFVQPSYSISKPTTLTTATNTNMSSVNDNSTAVYNYNVGISVGGTNASPDSIAKAVMREIKYMDSTKIRNQRAI